MFRAGHFVAAILCAVTYTVLNPEHAPPHVVARMQAEADAQAIADGLEAARDAHVTIPLRTKPAAERELHVYYDGGEWHTSEAQP
jgi:hypothetical protein